MPKERPTYSEYPGFQAYLAMLQQEHQHKIASLHAGWRPASKIGESGTMQAARAYLEQEYQIQLLVAHQIYSVPMLLEWRAAIASGHAIFHDEHARSSKINRQVRLQREEDGRVHLHLTITLPADAPVGEILAQRGLARPTWEARTATDEPVLLHASAEQVQTAIDMLLACGYRDVTAQARTFYQHDFPYRWIFWQQGKPPVFCKTVSDLFGALHKERKQWESQVPPEEEHPTTETR